MAQEGKSVLALNGSALLTCLAVSLFLGSYSSIPITSSFADSLRSNHLRRTPSICPEVAHLRFQHSHAWGPLLESCIVQVCIAAARILVYMCFSQGAQLGALLRKVGIHLESCSPGASWMSRLQ